MQVDNTKKTTDTGTLKCYSHIQSEKRRILYIGFREKKKHTAVEIK